MNLAVLACRIRSKGVEDNDKEEFGKCGEKRRSQTGRIMFRFITRARATKAKGAMESLPFSA